MFNIFHGGWKVFCFSPGTPDYFTKRELIFGFNRAFESRPIPLAARSLCNFIE
jgi:hypothetical protein